MIVSDFEYSSIEIRADGLKYDAISIFKKYATKKRNATRNNSFKVFLKGLSHGKVV